MERISLTTGSSNTLEFSRIIYGMWRLCDGTDAQADQVQAKIEACLEQGITTMDQADIYGGYEAQALLGACLKQAPHLRDQIEIVTKCDIIAPVGRYSDAKIKHYDTSGEHIRASIDQSLREMNIEHVDLLLIHRPDPLMDHIETGHVLDEVVKSGKVRTVGVSNFKPHDWNLLQSAMATPLVTNQIELSVLCHEGFTNGDIAFHQQHGIKPMAWSPLGGGALFNSADKAHNGELLSCLQRIANEQNSTADAVAVAWLLAHPSMILPIMGTNNIDRIKKLSAAADVVIDRQSWFEIYTAALGREVA